MQSIKILPFTKMIIIEKKFYKWIVFWYITHLFYILTYLEISQWYNCVNININAFYKPYELLIGCFWPNNIQSSSTQATIFPSAPGRIASSIEICKKSNIKYFITCVYCVNEIYTKKYWLIFSYCAWTYFFLNHSEFLVYSLEMVSVKTRSVK